MPVQLDIAGNFAKGQRTRENRQFERALDYELDKEELARRGAWRHRQDKARRMGEATEAYEDVVPTNENWFQRFASMFGARQRSRASPLNPAGFGDASADEAAVAGREAAALEVGPPLPEEVQLNPPSPEDDEIFQDGGYVGMRGRALPLTSPSANVFKSGGSVNRFNGNVNAGYQDGGGVGYVPPPSTISKQLGHRGRGYQAGGPVAPGVSGGMIAQRPGGVDAALSGVPGLTATPEPELGGGFPGVPVPGYQDGGLHAIHSGREKHNSPYIPAGPPTPDMGQRGQRTAIASAGVVPQEYQNGGYVGGNLAYSPGRATPAPGYQAGGPVGVHPDMGTGPRTWPRRLGAAARRGARSAREASYRATNVRNAPAGGIRKAGLARIAVPAAGIAAAHQGFRTPTSEYRERFGMSPYSEAETPLGQFASDLGVRAAGVTSDLANKLTLGGVGAALGWGDEEAPPPPATAIPPEIEEPPITPEDEIAEVATREGIRQAAEAEVQNAPPGAFDFSKSDIQLHEIPEMSVNDWKNYRSQSVIGLMEQGMTGQQAHESVNLEQQQGTLNYLAQAQQALAVGDRRSASLALYAAYQHFPNGTSLRFGTATSEDTGEQVLMATGIDQETGDPIGNPTAITQESLAALRANIEDPKNFLSWTKDWRDEQFQRQIYEEVEKPAAASRMQYERDVGAGNIMRGQADLAYQRSRGRAGGRTQADEDRANAAFNEATELLAMDNPADARALSSVMSQLFVQQNKEYTTIVDEVMNAYDGTDGGPGGLDGVADYLEQFE